MAQDIQRTKKTPEFGDDVKKCYQFFNTYKL